MELRHLRYFVAVAEELHFTRAAKRLHMAQQPLSAQIKQLEGEVGVELFSRANHRTELTPAGAAFLPEARAILAHAERAPRIARLAAEGALGTLRVGFCELVFEAVLARAVAQFLDERPRVHVELRSLTTPAQHRMLERGELDLAFGGAPADRDRFATRTLAHEPLVAMMSAAAAAGRASISLAELLEHPLVLLSREENAPHREQLDRVLARARHTIRQEAHDKPMLLNLVRAGVGATVLPQHTAKALPEGVVTVPISDLREDYRLVAVWRSDAPSIAGHAFVEVVARELPREPPPIGVVSALSGQTS